MPVPLTYLYNFISFISSLLSTPLGIKMVILSSLQTADKRQRETCFLWHKSNCIMGKTTRLVKLLKLFPSVILFIDTVSAQEEKKYCKCQNNMNAIS
jgi:hypothetical protein